MSRVIAEKLRALVAERAGHACEYCRMHENDLVLSAQVDHIISLKHHGSTTADNLAYSCLICNTNKGSDIATMLLPDNTPIRFYNPRQDKWEEHFQLSEAHILPKTKIGEATAKILGLNTSERVERRKLLIEAGRYPANQLIQK